MDYSELVEHKVETAEPASEASSRARELMLEYVDRVAERLGYIRMDHPPRLAERMREALGSASADAVVNELQLAIARNSRPLAEAGSDSEFARCVLDLFEGAVAKVERDQRDADIYAQSPQTERDPDPEFRRAANEAAVNSWEKT